jgi:hypothetical protein
LRRFLNNKRGQIRVIEAFFAAVLMISSITIIPAIQSYSSNSEGTLSSIALNVLTSIDNNGRLAELIGQSNWIAIQDIVESCISPALWFNLTIFDEQMEPLNDIIISSGSAIGNHIEVANYVCASNNMTYALYMVRLQLGGLN